MPTAANGLLIDDFSEGPITLRSYDRPTYSAEQNSLDPNQTAGGARYWSDFYHNIGREDATSTSYSQITVDPDEEVLDFQVQGNGSGYFALAYGSDESPLGLDLTAGGIDRLRFRYVGELSSPWIFSVAIKAPLIDQSGSGWISGQPLTPFSHFGLDPILEMQLPLDREDLDFSRIESIHLRVIRYRAGDYFRLDQIEAAASPLVGDFNRDGVVDLSDHAYWVSNVPVLERRRLSGELVPRTLPSFGSTVDGNGDGFVNAADYTVWRDAYDAAQQAANQVPEPSALLAAGFALLTAAGGRRRV